MQEFLMGSNACVEVQLALHQMKHAQALAEEIQIKCVVVLKVSAFMRQVF